jgi:hypothetical protein
MRTMFILAMAMVASSAHATKARLAALNQDVNGSYYVTDTRNIFLNPAEIMLLKDNANFEWGRKERTGLETPNAEAEGGFVYALGAGRLAAQLGRVTDFDRGIREINAMLPDITAALGVPGGVFGEGQNNLDVVYGGGDNMHWGAGATLTKSKTAIASNRSSNVQGLNLRGGVHNDQFGAFGGILLAAQSVTDVGVNNAKLSEGFGINGGASFQVKPEIKAYAHVSYDKYTAELSNGGPSYDGKRTGVMGGAAYTKTMDNNGRLYAAAELNYLNNDATNSQGAPEEQFQMVSVPVSLGLEADANSWLRMRAGVKQNVLIGNAKLTNGGTNNDNWYWENAPNTTQVSFGASASLNKFNFDAALVQSLNDDHGRALASMTYLF